MIYCLRLEKRLTMSQRLRLMLTKDFDDAIKILSLNYFKVSYFLAELVVRHIIFHSGSVTDRQ